MAAVLIHANSSLNIAGERNIVRTNGGTIYVVTQQRTNSRIAVFKSTDGSSWAEQDTTNAPSSSNYDKPVCAIDSTGIIHIAYYNGAATPTVRYVTFSTSTDTFSGDAQVTATNVAGVVSIAVDANDKPHLIYNNNAANMGTSYTGTVYTNRVSGSWKTGVVIEGSAAQKNTVKGSLIFAKNSSGTVVPQTVYNNNTDGDFTAALGNALDATSWTLQDVYAGSTSSNKEVSIACDSARDNTWVAYTDDSNHLFIVKHINTNTWSSWETATTLDATNSTNLPSIAVSGGDTYVIARRSSGNDIYLYKNTDAATLLENLTNLDQVQVKFSSYNDNNSSNIIDYVFNDFTNFDVYWNKITLINVVTKTFTADTVLLKNQTKTFTGDTVLQKSQTKTFTSDTVLNTSKTKTFTSDSVLLKNQTKTFTSDSVLLKNQTKTLTTDTVLEKNQTKTFTLDSVLAQNQTKTFTTDTILLQNLTKDFTLDTVLEKSQEKTFTSDTVLEKTQTQTFTLDTILEKNQSQTFTIDAVLQKTQTQTFTIDVVLLQNQTKTFTLDSVLQETVEKTFTLDSILLAENQKTFTIDGVLLAENTKDFTLDTVLLHNFTKDITLDTVLEKNQTVSFTVDAFLDTLAGNFKTFTIDTVLSYTQTKTFTLDTILSITVLGITDVKMLRSTIIPTILRSTQKSIFIRATNKTSILRKTLKNLIMRKTLRGKGNG